MLTRFAVMALAVTLLGAGAYAVNLETPKATSSIERTKAGRSRDWSRWNPARSGPARRHDEFARALIPYGAGATKSGERTNSRTHPPPLEREPVCSPETSSSRFSR